MSDAERICDATDRHADAVQICNNLISEDAQLSTDKEHEKFTTASDKLLEVKQRVDELHAFARKLKLNGELVLGGQLERQVCKLLSDEGLQELYDGKRQDARLRILAAAGLCLKGVHVVYFMDGDLLGETELSVSEVEALYRPVESSTALTALWIREDPELDYLKPESWQLLADILLGPTGLEKFHYSSPSLSGLSHVAKAVTASGRGPLPLRSLHFKTPLKWSHPAPNISPPTTKSLQIEWAGNVATLIRAAPSLKELQMHLGSFADADGAELIGSAIASHQSLESLSITWGGDEVAQPSLGESGRDESESNKGGSSAHTVSTEDSELSCVGHLLSVAFLGLPRNTSIHSLSFSFYGRGKLRSMPDLQVLSHVLQMGITELTLEGIERILTRDLRSFLETVQARAHLQSLTLLSGPGAESMGFDTDSFAMLVELLKSNSMDALKHLSLRLRPSYDSNYLQTFDWPGFYTALKQKSAIESLEVGGYAGYVQAEREILEYIQTTKALQTLNFYYFSRGENITWRSIFRSLRGNTGLRRLWINSLTLEDDDAYREFMAMLQVNSSLQEVEFYGDAGERGATVREALRCKARQESYLAELRKGLGRQGQAEWESPRCGRIFLCGSAQAGKTRLTSTMLKLVKGNSMMKRLKEKLLRRTRGIEIHTLRNDDQMQILVWDLAGQDIFRALQQFVFPRLSKASVFIFVFSPFYQAQEFEDKKLKTELGKAFEKELLEWLKFIASNSAVTGFNLPQVMVVISHRDMYNSEEVDLNWTKTTLARFIDDFKDVIDIHRDPYFIDGHESEQVLPIVDELYSMFFQLFQEKLFKVPMACTHMSQELVRWASRHPEEPVINDQKFFSLCGNIPDLQSFSQKIDGQDNKRLLKAVGSYLHDVGTVIDMTLNDVKETREKPTSNLMVINPNWLTHVFLGRLISLRHNFQLTPGEELEWAGSVDGFLCQTDFLQFLRKRILKPMKKLFPKLSLQTLQDLMESLDLLYVIGTDDLDGHNDSRFFVPTLVKAKTEQTLQWRPTAFPERTGEIFFLGVRLRCKDSKRTYLSAAFFSRFQVTIWRKLKEQLQSSNPSIECKFNVMSVLVDMLDILIENDEDGDFIDVLIRSTKSRGTVWDFVEKHIVEELRDFCASPRGCPGVELVVDIIRTECVQRLTLCKHRKNQSVSKEDLKRNVMISVQNLGPGSQEGDLYSHTWMRVSEAGLEAACEEAVELLPPKDIEEVRGWIRGKTQSVKARVVKLEEVIMEIDDSREMKGIVSSELKEEKKIVRSTSEQWVNPSEQRLENMMEAMHADLSRKITRVGEDVKEVLAQVLELKLEIQHMNSLQRIEARKVTHTYDKLDKLVGNSGSTTEWPKRPYFTHKDVSFSHRITATVEIGKPLILHFECEEKDRHHIVPKQPGYAITVGEENCEALRQISHTSVQVIWYLLKAGLHMSTGMGALVPELQTSDGNTSLLTSLSMARLLHKVQLEDGRSSKQAHSRCSPEEAWRYLQGFLGSSLKFQITKYFLLHRAEYSDSRSTRAWLCQECLANGLKNSSIRKS